MASQRLVSGLPRVFASLPPSPALLCMPCVEGRLRTTPHSSLRPASAPFLTLHLDVWGPAPRLGLEREGYFLVVIDDYFRHTTVFPLAKKSESGATLRLSATPLRTSSWLAPSLVSSLVSRWTLMTLSFTTRPFLDSRDVRFDESGSYYTHYPCRGLPVPPPRPFLTPTPPSTPAPPIPQPPPSPAPSGVSHATPLPSVARQVTSPSPQSSSRPPQQPSALPRQVAVDSGGVGDGGASTGGAHSWGARSRGVGAGGAGTEGASLGGAGVGGAGTGGASLGVARVVFTDLGRCGFGGAGAGDAGTGGASSEETRVGGTTTAAPTAPPHSYDTPGARAVGATAGAGEAAAAAVAAIFATACCSPCCCTCSRLSCRGPSCLFVVFSALTTSVTEFAATCLLDYATRVVASPPLHPLSAGGESALGCDVLEDKQFELEFFAATSPSRSAMLLSSEGDPDAQPLGAVSTMAGPEERGGRGAGGSGEAQAQGQPCDSAMAPVQPSLGPPRDEPRVFGLDKFNGDNFAEWSFRMENVFDHYDLLEVMEGTEKRPENDPEKSPWVRKSAQGYLLLGQALGRSQIRHIKPFQREPEKGPKAWTALKGVHAPATAAVAVVLERQMAALRIEEDEAVEEGVPKFFDLLTRLEGADLNYSELQKKTKLLALLPETSAAVSWQVRMAPGQQALAEDMAVEGVEDEGEADLVATTSMEAAGVEDTAATTRATDAVASDSTASATIVTRADICGAIASSSLTDGPMLKAKRAEEQEEGKEEAVEAVAVAEVVLQEPDAVGKVTLHSLDYWVIDSGATYNMTPRADLLTELEPSPVKHVISALGQRAEVKGTGKAMFKGADGKMVGLKNIPVVPMFEERQVAASISTKGEAVGSGDGANGRDKEIESKKCNLGGTSKLGEHEESGAAAKKQQEGEENPKAAAEEDYGESMWGTIASAAFSNPTSATGECDWLTLHRRMRHVALPILHQLVKNEMVAGIRVKGEPDEPKAFDDGSGRVWKLKKALYGLKQAPRQWYLKLREVLEEIGFTPSSADHSLFMLGEGVQRSFMVVYVDDILIFSPSSELVKEVMLKLQDKFKCKALGDVSFNLGLHIERDVEKRCMWVHQRKYLDALAANCGQSEGHVATLFPSGF
ncbi:unnamed protein product [Closterium sp. NIES-54]